MAYCPFGWNNFLAVSDTEWSVHLRQNKTQVLTPHYIPRLGTDPHRADRVLESLSLLGASCSHALRLLFLFVLSGSGTGVVWRTDLAMTEKHWRGWFEGLSSSFLDLSIPKLLIVAGMDRLDPELTAAHMQGKFQLKLVYGCGHSIQEDQPRETTSSIMSFAFRHSILRKGKPRADDTWNPSDEEELARKLARARGQR